MSAKMQTNVTQTADSNTQERQNLRDERFSTEITSIIPRKRQEVLKWYGWGYNDSHFYIKNNVICFEGKRYPLEGCTLPDFTEYVRQRFGFLPQGYLPLPKLPTEYAKPTVNSAFLQIVQQQAFVYSMDGEDRLIRCHGQTLHDIFSLWTNTVKRIPDIVVWPKSHGEVEQLVAAAHKFNVMLIPYGGGTSVSGAITCPEQEERMICVLDTSQMNRLLWLSRQDLTVCFEAGIIGQDLERELRKKGLTVGHEPDSYEFSTLGGWVATRASGMKKNVYGNIEDLLVQVRLVTPTGVLERNCVAPRISCGPDFNHIIMGSEGTLGVITEVVLKVRPLPPVKRYGSLVFPNFESGVKFMREVAVRRCQPASVRLVDNEQFILGQTLKPVKSWAGGVVEHIKKAYVTKIKGLDLSKICAVTLLFEGEKTAVDQQESLINEIAKQCKGFAAGAENGERGYILTYVIAYIRDLAIEQGIIGESFETSVPWARCSILCHNVKNRVALECRRKNVKFVISCRVTQTYDAGACVYFYFAFRFNGIENPIETYEFIENCARDEILASGGSVSHHHGVGKVRSQWYKQTVSQTGSDLYMAAKRQLDPKNIFALNNLLPHDIWEKHAENFKSKL